MISNNKKFILWTILFCHFISAFSVLGLAPFFSLVVEKSFHLNDSFWTGLFYAVPTLMLAICSPFWGMLADRIGKKNSLLRAQIGLALSFLLAGFAMSPAWLLFALVLQGALGGTFSASNALLANYFKGKDLALALNGTQTSARLAFIVAPVSIGWMMHIANPLELYHYLFVLPVFSAVMIALLPSQEQLQDSKIIEGSNKSDSQVKLVEPAMGGHDRKSSLRLLHLMQFVLAFVAVMTYPYFVSYCQYQFPELSTAVFGFLFAVPHIAYILIQPINNKLIHSNNAMSLFILGLIAFSLIQALHVFSYRFEMLLLLRIAMGFSMSLSMAALNQLIAVSTSQKSAGKTFGMMDFFSKSAGFFAGVAASFAVVKGVEMPFLISAATAIIIACYLIIKTSFSVDNHFIMESAHD